MTLDEVAVQTETDNADNAVQTAHPVTAYHVCSRHLGREIRKEMGIKSNRVPDLCRNCTGIDFVCDYYLMERRVARKRENGYQNPGNNGGDNGNGNHNDGSDGSQNENT